MNNHYETLMNEIMGLKKLPATPYLTCEVSNTRNYTVIDIQTYNDRVVKLTFSDGTETKAICGEHDTFNLEHGIEICLLKKFMGGSSKYNNTINKAVRYYNECERNRENEKAKELERIARHERIKNKRERQKSARNDRQFKSMIDILAENGYEVTKKV